MSAIIAGLTQKLTFSNKPCQSVSVSAIITICSWTHPIEQFNVPAPKFSALIVFCAVSSSIQILSF